MKTLIADQELVAQLLPMSECIEVMADALGMLAGGDALLPLRTMLMLPRDSGNLMGLMPSYLGGIESVGVKVIAAFPSNYGSEYDTHQGVVVLFDTRYGLLRAIADGTTITAIRTAAVSGVATRLLAREDAGDLAIIGAGTQARTHLEAMLNVRPIRRVRVYSQPLEGAYRFAEREARRHSMRSESPGPLARPGRRSRALRGHAARAGGAAGAGFRVEVMETAQSAVEGADIVCTVTTAREPVLKGEWLAPGAHINAVGAFTPTSRELDTMAVARSRLYVDRRESTLNEAGDFLIPKREGAIGDDHIVGELGELLLGKIVGRRSPDEITLFKSLGIAVEDLAAVHHVWRRAQDEGVGTWVEIGGAHFGSRQ